MKARNGWGFAAVLVVVIALVAHMAIQVTTRDALDRVVQLEHIITLQRFCFEFSIDEQYMVTNAAGKPIIDCEFAYDYGYFAPFGDGNLLMGQRVAG